MDLVVYTLDARILLKRKRKEKSVIALQTKRFFVLLFTLFTLWFIALLTPGNADEVVFHNIKLGDRMVIDQLPGNITYVVHNKITTGFPETCYIGVTILTPKPKGYIVSRDDGVNVIKWSGYIPNKDSFSFSNEVHGGLHVVCNNGVVLVFNLLPFH